MDPRLNGVWIWIRICIPNSDPDKNKIKRAKINRKMPTRHKMCGSRPNQVSTVSRTDNKNYMCDISLIQKYR
jgi:hypothetical protein